MSLTRRDLILQSAALLVAPRLRAAASPLPDWIRTTRGLIAEPYNPPFYPSLDYEPAKAIRIAREINADSFRYPTASYFAYFPTKSGYPIHPELKGDPMRDYVRSGGALIATHLTSVADEYGRVRKDFGLADLFGASFINAEPIEIPDLYLKPSSGGDLIPQDPQVMPFRVNGATTLAETIDRGHRQNLGPAIVSARSARDA